MMNPDNDLDLMTCPDESNEAEIWDRLWKEDSIRLLDIEHIMVQVKDGEVFLSGHLAQEGNLALIETIARSIPDVNAVHNHLVTDDSLRIQIAQAFFKDNRTRSFILPVSVHHGWVSLGGEVPTRDLQFITEEVAGQVPAVRGIITLPRVAGEKSQVVREAVQPRIGTPVYDQDGLAGQVFLVVIRPCNRLVTEVIVSYPKYTKNQVIQIPLIVPVHALSRVTKENSVLDRNGPALDGFPTLNPGELIQPPIGWKPPYPYTVGDVRWRLGENLETGRRSMSRFGKESSGPRAPSRHQSPEKDESKTIHGKGETEMKTDLELREEVEAELERERSGAATEIGVIVTDGIITLTGWVDSLMEKWAAHKAALRVKGVKAVANEIVVRSSNAISPSDEEIARAASSVLTRDVTLPRDIQVVVADGWVTLRGEVEWQFQKDASEEGIKGLPGVKGVVNKLIVKAQVATGDVKETIEASLRQRASEDTSEILVTTEGSKVTLEGRVHSWAEKEAAEEAAWSTLGVTYVDNQLLVI